MRNLYFDIKFVFFKLLMLWILYLKIMKLILLLYEIVIHFKNIKYYYWRNYITIDIMVLNKNVLWQYN
jgi:hypothetical protein